MPCITQSFSRKRRRDDDELDQGIHITIPQNLDDKHHYAHNEHPFEHHVHAPPRKPIAYLSPLAKKIRLTTSPEWQAIQEQRPTALTPQNPRHTRSLSASARTMSIKPAAQKNLNPCHICHRRPTKKTELDSFANCQGCGERTCYVCIRECLGWKGLSSIPTPVSAITNDYDDNAMRDDCHEIRYDTDDDANSAKKNFNQQCAMDDAPPADRPNEAAYGSATEQPTWGQGRGRGHRGRICSQCCIEEGPTGEVICLGCLGS